MKTLLLHHPALRLLVFPALLTSPLHAAFPAAADDAAPVARTGLTEIAHIEQQVLAREFENSSTSLMELAMTLGRTEVAEEKARLQLSIAKYVIWLNDLDEQLRKTGVPAEEISDPLHACSYRLNEIAWHMLLRPEFSGIPHDIPKMLAAVAVRRNETAPEIRDTYARALAVAGAMDQAVAEEEKALQASKENPGTGDDFEAALAAYRKGVIPEAQPPSDWSEPSEPSESAESPALEEERERQEEERERQEEEREKQEEAAETARDKASRLNEIAWNMATSHRQIPQRAVPLADIALALSREGGSFRSRILDTKARGLFASRHREEAMKLQQEAIDGCDKDDDLKEELEATLECYRKDEAPPTPEDQDSDEVDYEDDGGYLNDLAWSLVTRKDADAGHAQTARTLAEAALNWDAENKEMRPAYLDTLARAAYLINRGPGGNPAEVLEIQKQAIAAAEADPDEVDEDLLAKLKEHLTAYEKNELPDEPEADEP